MNNPKSYPKAVDNRENKKASYVSGYSGTKMPLRCWISVLSNQVPARRSNQVRQKVLFHNG